MTTLGVEAIYCSSHRQQPTQKNAKEVEESFEDDA